MNQVWAKGNETYLNLCCVDIWDVPSPKAMVCLWINGSYQRRSTDLISYITLYPCWCCLNLTFFIIVGRNSCRGGICFYHKLQNLCSLTWSQIFFLNDPSWTTPNIRWTNARKDESCSCPTDLIPCHNSEAHHGLLGSSHRTRVEKSLHLWEHIWFWTLFHLTVLYQHNISFESSFDWISLK